VDSSGLRRMRLRRLGSSEGGGGSGVQSVLAGDGIDVDDDNPETPIVSNTGVLDLTEGTGITVGGTAQHPTVANDGVLSVTAGTGITNSGTAADPVVALANMAAATIKGRAVGAGTGAPTDLTPAQATAILDAFTSALKGLVPASGGGTANFLRADGTWAAPPAGAMVLIQSQDDATTPITFSTGIAGDDASVLGYRLVGRIRCSAVDNISLFFNNNTSADYSYTLTLNDGAVTTAQASGQGVIVICPSSFMDDDNWFSFTIDIPVSGQTGSGFNVGTDVIWQARARGGEGSVGLIHGAGHWNNAAQLTRIDFDGSFEAGSRVALYRIVRA
jgi:hypothetical protein